MEVTGPEHVSIDVGDDPDRHCGLEWRPRAFALRVGAEDLPDDPELLLRSHGTSFHFAPLGDDGREHLGDGPIPDGTSSVTTGGEPGAAILTATAVSRYPGFDVVHFRFDGEEGFAQTLSYVDPPLRDGAGAVAEVDGQSFLQIELTPIDLQAHSGPERLEAPPDSALTQLVLLDVDGDSVTWVVGIDGEATPVRAHASSFRGPRGRTGSTSSIHIRHPGG